MYDDAALHAELSALAARITPAGWCNSLGQKLIQLTMPGRAGRLPGHRAVGQLPGRPGQPPPGRLRRCAGSCWPASTTAGCRRSTTSGAAKLLVVSRAARLRRDRPELFTGYRPVPAHGPAAGHVVAFDRGGAITVATRLPLRLAACGGWDGTAITVDGEVTDVLTGRCHSGGPLPLADLLDPYPVALLVTSAPGRQR